MKCIVVKLTALSFPYHQTFRFEAIDRSLSPIDRLKGSGEIGLSIAYAVSMRSNFSVSCIHVSTSFILLTSRGLNKAIKLNFNATLFRDHATTV